MAKIVKPDPTYQWASAATVIGLTLDFQTVYTTDDKRLL